MGLCIADAIDILIDGNPAFFFKNTGEVAFAHGGNISQVRQVVFFINIFQNEVLHRVDAGMDMVSEL